ncbi:GumC family protein [Sphingobacterium sp. R2]|uniref:GumC family protein n=1 Tax=Sphingobacterium sp. R2 TaxID=3112958 RepID=UPI00345D0488
MGIVIYIIKSLYRFKWWLIVLPLLVMGIVIYFTRNMNRQYESDMTIYTGIISANGTELSQDGKQDWNILKNSLLNVINTIGSKETMRVVSLKLFARTMINGDPERDNVYVSSAHFRQLLDITPSAVKKLIDKTSEERTVENLKRYEKMDAKNFVYGLFNWNHPYFSYGALSKIDIKQIDNSDILHVYYENNDAGITYQTLNILSEVFADEYKTLQYSNTNNVIKYFEAELARIGKDLFMKEDSLTKFNVQNRVIHYDKQTEAVTILDKDYEIRKQDALSARNRAQVSIAQLESGIDANIKSIKNNAQFLAKMNDISDLNYSISQIESYRPDSLKTTVTNSASTLEGLKSKLRNQERDFRNFIQEYSSQKYTKNGYPNANYVAQWVDELLKLDQAQADIKVVDDFKIELDKMYSHYSPIGSLLKRQERGINFTEQSYLSVLGGLNAARLRLKSLEMSAATLKVINPATYPLNSKPTKRKMLVMGTYFATLVFLLGCILVLELLDRTLRDKQRTDRVTKGNVIGAFPYKKMGRYSEQIKKMASKSLANQLFGYFKRGNAVNFINVLKLDEAIDSGNVMRYIKEEWETIGLKVGVLEEAKDFNAKSREFLIENTLLERIKQGGNDFTLVGHTSSFNIPVPPFYLAQAAVNLLLLDAESAWKEEDDELFKELDLRSGTVPVLICLVNADRFATETFTGMLPPYSFLRKLEYRFSQLGITASKA